MARTTYRLKNWRAYNRALIQRGSLTVWVSQEALDAWEYDGPNQHGGQFTYSDLAIETCLKLRLIYKLALRQSQGFVASVFQILGLDELPIPDYSTLSRRHDGLSVDLCAHQKDDPEGEAEDGSSPRHIVIDSTGLKVYGEGEPTHRWWVEKQRQHGKSKRRTWRKGAPMVHIGFDPEAGEITATRLTDNRTDDASQVESLLQETLEQGPGHRRGRRRRRLRQVEELSGDPGGRGTPRDPAPEEGQDQAARQHEGRAVTAGRGDPLHRSPWAEEVEARAGLSSAESGRDGDGSFQGDHRGVLRARKLVNQLTEARLGSKILNQMLALGRPESYAVALA